MIKITTGNRLSILAGLLLLGGVPSALAQCDLSWYTVDGGGDMWTTGGNFELSGTIGQPDAGVVMTGGNFELSGGFWAGAPPFGLADLNCDGAINAFDIDPFVLALTNPAGYAAAYPDCNRMLADINCDGAVDAFDIDGFVECLVGTCPPCPPC